MEGNPWKVCRALSGSRSCHKHVRMMNVLDGSMVRECPRERYGIGVLKAYCFDFKKRKVFKRLQREVQDYVSPT